LFPVVERGVKRKEQVSEVTVQKMPFGGWRDCVQVTNGIVDLVVTLDVGPRVIRYGFVGDVNELCEIESTLGVTGGDEWRIYGGHRLWHSPESRLRTYEPDNLPVSCEEIDGGIRTVQKTEPLARIQKEMEITLSPSNTRTRLRHRLTNRGAWPAELSVWSITAMAQGGREFVPHVNSDTGLLPNRSVSLWPYSRMNDPRVYWGDDYITLMQDPQNTSPFKFGVPNESGWAAYCNHGHLFVKYYTHLRNAPYPDFNVSYETYTNHLMLEMETLSPLTVLGSGEDVSHTEEWELFDNAPMLSWDEGEIRRVICERVTGKK
jgi:hypothetical protein